MQRPYFYLVTALMALVTGLAAAFGPPPVDKAASLAPDAPAAVAGASLHRRLPTTTSTTVAFVEHDDNRSRLVTTTTTTSTTTTTVAATQAATAPSKPSKSPTTTVEQAPAGGYSSSAESKFASSINGLRSGNGLPGLSRSGSLDAEARAWSKRMAENGSISHSNLGRFLPPWSKAGENVGAGGSVGGVFDALAASPGHRANMLGDYTHFGIGVWVDGSGQIWTTHVFAG